MAVIANKKKSFFGLSKIKKAVKNFIKKTKSIKESKKEKTPVYQVDFEAEIEQNSINEALELRLLQMIEASPASLEMNINLKGTMFLTTEPLPEIQFGTFWVSDDEDSFSISDLPLPSPPPSVVVSPAEVVAS